jgi:hypothetical protein
MSKGIKLCEKSFRCKNLDGDSVIIDPHWKSVRGVPGRKGVSFRDRYTDTPNYGLKAVVRACGRGKEVRCPIRWYCTTLNRVIEVRSDAIPVVFPGGKFGFMCDCCSDIVTDSHGNKFGNPVWVTGVDINHTHVIFGVRVVV